jgi:nucleoside-triphosphatase THEP1
MWETAPFTHIVKRNKKNTLGNEFLDANLSLHRIQSYSPSIRVFDGKNGIHKVGEKLFDIRKFATVTDEKNNSLVSVSDAAKKVKEWLNKARIHVGGMGKSNGMARLELTFQSKSLDFVVLEKGIDTSIRTFHQSTKVYSGSLVANFAKISLLAFEGISNALFHWFGPHSNISEPTSWDVFSEVWNYLTHVATHFFDGRRSYLTNRLYSPRLGYIFSRPFLNPSWTGINQAIISICSDDNLEKLRHIWYEKSKMMDSYKRATNTNLTSSILDLDNKFEIKLSALHHLVSANCRTNINDAVACSHCQTISSSIDSKKESWKQHPCNWNDFMNSSSTSLPRDIDIRGPLFDSYLTRVTQLLSQSQLESLTAIMGTNQNCFLTGVAGSGKSFLLKVFYPMMIRMYGFCGVSVTGPTNIAASNVCGKTIHKFFGLIADSPSEAMIYEINDGNLQKLLRNHIDNLNRLSPHVIQNVALCQVLIIDEAGMIDCATMNFVDQFFRMVKMSENPFGGVRIILIGDVLQLEPVQKKAFSNNNKAFYEHHTFKKFFVAYLRTNIRQQDDAEFLNALNKIRIGDGTAAEYLIKFVSPLNNTSKITLQMARSKKDIPLNERDRHKLDSRIKYFGLQNSRIRLKNNGSEEYNLEISNLDKRIDNAEDTGYSDLIVCHDNIERTIYTTLKNSRHELTRCYSQDRQSLYPPLEWRNETLKNMLLKLLPVLDIYVGMSCRVTYPTKSEYVCTNALVVIKGFEVVDNKVAEIHVESVEKKIKVSLIPVTISESILHHEISRTQFGLIDSAALVPWSLQCLTISDNIFYDNSRSSTTSSAVKGALYTIISRVKRKEQFSYLHSITYEEISHGVSVKGKNFDDKYRLQDCVIFNMIPFDIVY